MTFDHDPIAALADLIPPLKRAGIDFDDNAGMVYLHFHEGGLRSPHTFATVADRTTVKAIVKNFLAALEQPRFTGQLRIDLAAAQPKTVSLYPGTGIFGRKKTFFRVSRERNAGKWKLRLRERFNDLESKLAELRDSAANIESRIAEERHREQTP